MRLLLMAPPVLFWSSPLVPLAGPTSLSWLGFAEAGSKLCSQVIALLLIAQQATKAALRCLGLSPKRPHEKFGFGVALRHPSPPSRGAVLRPHQPLSARLRRRRRGSCAPAAHDGTAAAAALVTGCAPPDPAATAAGRGGSARLGS